MPSLLVDEHQSRGAAVCALLAMRRDAPRSAPKQCCDVRDVGPRHPRRRSAEQGRLRTSCSLTPTRLPIEQAARLAMLLGREVQRGMFLPHAHMRSSRHLHAGNNDNAHNVGRRRRGERDAPLWFQKRPRGCRPSLLPPVAPAMRQRLLAPPAASAMRQRRLPAMWRWPWNMLPSAQPWRP